MKLHTNRHTKSVTRSSATMFVLLIFSLLAQPVLPVLAQPARTPMPATPLPAPSPPVAPSALLFRTRVHAETPAQWQRLEDLDLRVLEQGPDWALVLVDAEQLEALARLRFEPEGTDEVGALVAAHVQDKAWLSTGLQPLLNQASTLQKHIDTESVRAEEALAELRTAIHGLAPEQMAGLAALTSVDDDADGLTNTQEKWWCTDPMNPDTDSDGKTDGAEIQVLKDWLANRRSGPPNETPWPDWPPQRAGCDDKDHDSIPNLAERWELGLKMDLESSDLDKFDDGQELFGVTYCPGGDLNCNYGDLPRSSDSGYVGANMPAWVEPPGNHPMVAAFPVPEIDVVESSLHVETVTTITTDHVISEGTERSYSTSKLEGTSSSVANTETWNEWQETIVVEISDNSDEPEPEGRDVVPSTAIAPQATSGGGILGGILSFVGLEAGAKAVDGVLDFGWNCVTGPWKEGEDECVSTISTVGKRLVKDYGTVVDDVLDPDVDLFQKGAMVTACSPLGVVGSPLVCRAAVKHYHPEDDDFLLPSEEEQQQDSAGGEGFNIHLGVDGLAAEVAKLIEASYPTYGPRQTREPTPSISNATGYSQGKAFTETHEEYEEHTVTNGEAFSSEEAWGTATAVDSSHAADLWFTYQVRNTGSEYSRDICNLAFNIYIGDDPSPVYTYFVSQDLGGDGCFHNFKPDEEHEYSARTDTHAVPLTLEQMKAIDLGARVRIIIEDFTYGVDEFFYEDASAAGVLAAIEDGTDDGDQTIDTYLIPTWGEEMVLDALARYFPHETDVNGNLNALWTPEYRTDTPSWCQAPRNVGMTLWCKHDLSTTDWWNIYLGGLGDGSQGFQDTPAAPGSVVLFRFNRDGDQDGYSDRSEIRFGTDPEDPFSHPKPELIAGVHNVRAGDHVTSTLSLLNTDLYDASAVDAVMVAPDDSVSITNNIVGGSGRVRALDQVIVGSRIELEDPLATPWTQSGHAMPVASGYYTGTQDITYTFTVSCGEPTGCDVGAGTWSLNWNDGIGNSGSLNFGGGYASPLFQPVGDLGVELALYSGKVYNGESFSVDALTPRDTFQYTINREPYTPPIVIVSYNDPQGNHRFITPVELSHPQEDLIPYSGQMVKDFGAQIATTEPFSVGSNTTSSLSERKLGSPLQ